MSPVYITAKEETFLTKTSSPVCICMHVDLQSGLRGTCLVIGMHTRPPIIYIKGRNYAPKNKAKLGVYFCAASKGWRREEGGIQVDKFYTATQNCSKAFFISVIDLSNL